MAAFKKFGSSKNEYTGAIANQASEIEQDGDESGAEMNGNGKRLRGGRQPRRKAKALRAHLKFDEQGIDSVSAGAGIVSGGGAEIAQAPGLPASSKLVAKKMQAAKGKTHPASQDGDAAPVELIPTEKEAGRAEIALAREIEARYIVNCVGCGYKRTAVEETEAVERKESKVAWVGCEYCNVWQHQLCHGMLEDEAEAMEFWVCSKQPCRDATLAEAAKKKTMGTAKTGAAQAAVQTTKEAAKDVAKPGVKGKKKKTETATIPKKDTTTIAAPNKFKPTTPSSLRGAIKTTAPKNTAATADTFKSQSFKSSARGSKAHQPIDEDVESEGETPRVIPGLANQNELPATPNNIEILQQKIHNLEAEVKANNTFLLRVVGLLKRIKQSALSLEEAAQESEAVLKQAEEMYGELRDSIRGV